MSQYLWLEDIDSPKAMDWVNARNKEVLTQLTDQPFYQKTYQALLGVYNSDYRIPFVYQCGGFLYNFWRDTTNPRGLWRRTTLDEYRKPNPQWQILLDIDALAREENENWVWGGEHGLFPRYQRWLISLSRGGTDAHVTREFDITTGQFVADGFNLPAAKSNIAWINKNEVYICTDFGSDSLTESGYPRVMKRWHRGTPLTSAKTMREVEKKDVRISIGVTRTQKVIKYWAYRVIDFFNDELFLLTAKDHWLKIDKPSDASFSLWRDQALIQLRSDWHVNQQIYPSGSLLAIDFDAYQQGDRRFEILFTPNSQTALSTFTHTRDHILLTLLDNVSTRIILCTYSNHQWSSKPLDFPSMSTLDIQRFDRRSNNYFIRLTDFLTPTTFALGKTNRRQYDILKTSPAFFNTDNLMVEQWIATSTDGTPIPYFVVRRKDLTFDGNNPTLLYGYGGYEIALQPEYNADIGISWLNQGGTYVLANIRGGGEFGPSWHKAAQKENRQLAFDDFIAVANDLMTRKLTSPRRLGIMGGSNGGLLVGAVMVQRPELFGAVVCHVPLLDMQRYHLLLAGASWVGEYGNPDDPEQWAYISRYSPYQNVKSNAHYPPCFFLTSTRDDRVHPGHARKMAAKMIDQGHEVLFFENIEGGHAGATNNEQHAEMSALGWMFLREKLF